MSEEVDRKELQEEIKQALKNGLANLDLSAVSIQEFSEALKSATFEVLKENVPDFDQIVNEYMQKYPDAWLVAEDTKQFYIVKPLTRLE